MPYEYTPWVKLRSSNFELSCGWKPSAWIELFKWKLLNSTSLYFQLCTNDAKQRSSAIFCGISPSNSVLWDFLNQSCWAFLSSGNFYNILQGAFNEVLLCTPCNSVCLSILWKFQTALVDLLNLSLESKVWRQLSRSCTPLNVSFSYLTYSWNVSSNYGDTSPIYRCRYDLSE